MRILITDDSVVSRMQMQRIASRLNCEIALAECGEEAWDILEKTSEPTLILLDRMLPGLSGVELCERIRAEQTGSQPYIIFVSGRTRTQDIVEGLEAGANDYLTKPFNSAELFARLNVGVRFITLQEQLSRRIRELEEARKHVRELQSFLPVCMYCRKVSPGEAAWSDLEQYVEEHVEVKLSHVICPKCMSPHGPD